MAGGGGEEAAAAAAEGTPAEAAEAAAASGSAAGASSEDAGDFRQGFPGHAAPEPDKFSFLLFAALQAMGEQFYELDDEEGFQELIDHGLNDHMDTEEHVEMWYALYCTLAAGAREDAAAGGSMEELAVGLRKKAMRALDEVGLREKDWLAAGEVLRRWRVSLAHHWDAASSSWRTKLLLSISVWIE